MKKKTKVLNLKTRPFNSIEIFSNIINKVLHENKNILYVFCSEEKEYIKVRINGIYEFLYKTISSKQLENNIHFVTLGDIEDIDESYDLVIVDDISLFSKISSEYIRESIENIYWKSSKIIIYSSEYIFPIGEKIECGWYQNRGC